MCAALFSCPHCMRGRITEFGSLCFLICLSKTDSLGVLKRKGSFSAVQFFVAPFFCGSIFLQPLTLKALVVSLETDVLGLCGTCALYLP